MDWWSAVERMGLGSCSERMATHVELEEGFERKCAEGREGRRSEKISRAEMVV